MAKKDDEPTLDERVTALQISVNKKYAGKGRLQRASEIVLPYYMLRRPCGIIDLDIATGGGLPAGGLIEIIGPEGACKTWLLTQYMVMQQLLFGDECVLGACQTEMHFDKLFARMSRLRIPYHDDEIARMEELEERVFSEEELADLRDFVGHFQEAFADSAEVLYDILLKMLTSKLFNVIGIDSWGSMLTIQEEKKGMKDKTRGGSAKVNSEFLRRFSAMMMGVHGDQIMTTVIGINQMRDRMDGQGFSIQGGWALKHHKFISIRLSPGSPLYRNAKGVMQVGTGEGDSVSKLTKVGKVIRWQILKGKAGCHDGPTGEFHFYFDGGADLERALVIAGQMCGVVSTSGAWLAYGKLKRQGVANMADTLRKDRKLHDKLYASVLKANGVTPNYR